MGNGKMRPASKSILRRIISFVRAPQGNVAVITAILLVPIIGAIAVGTEVSGWLVEHRAEQNAADTAVISAATQGGNGFADWQNMGKAVAASYGFPASRATVTVANPASVTGVSACNNAACYSVTISMSIPIGLASVVGYGGTSGNQTVQAFAIANTKTTLGPFCLLVLNGGILAHGVPKANMTCNIFASASADCTGHDLTSGFSDVLASSGQDSCGGNQITGEGSGTDPYAAGHTTALAKDAPNQNCPSYYPDSNNNWPKGTNYLTTNITAAVSVFCGDVELGANIQITNSSALIVIENGQLDTNGFQIQTSSGDGATIVFNGPSGNTYTSGGTPSNFIGGGGTVDIAAPTSGDWSGMAIFQNSPANQPLTQTSVTYTGNSPTLAITGVIDAPQLNLTAKGAVSKSTNGAACITLVVASLDVRGTGDLFYSNPQSQCQNAGVTQAQEPAGVIGQLVE